LKFSIQLEQKPTGSRVNDNVINVQCSSKAVLTGPTQEVGVVWLMKCSLIVTGPALAGAVRVLATVLLSSPASLPGLLLFLYNGSI